MSDPTPSSDQRSCRCRELGASAGADFLPFIQASEAAVGAKDIVCVNYGKLKLGWVK